MALRITRDHITNVFAADQPAVAEAAPGEVLVFETLDAAAGRIKTREQALTIVLPREQANPATGPVVVRGSEPGDTLAVKILDVQPGPVGLCRIRAGSGVIIGELKPPVANLIPVRAGVVHFNDRIRFPARPMVGVIGVAPAAGAVSTFYPGPHGGNLDINDVRPGATVYLPVRHAGAYLSVGDVHASMGDGELTGGGIDILAEVTVRVDVRRGLGWERPVVESDDAWATCGNGPTAAEAIRVATSEMATLLATALQMSREEAFILIGAAGDARIGQAAELGMDATAYVRVAKAILPAPAVLGS